MRKPRTVRQQHIEQVAGIIYEANLTEEDARAINSGDGWGFDIQYDHEEYAEGWFTRVREVSLPEEDLLTAIEMAARWQRGEWLPEELP